MLILCVGCFDIEDGWTIRPRCWFCAQVCVRTLNGKDGHLDLMVHEMSTPASGNDSRHESHLNGQLTPRYTYIQSSVLAHRNSNEA
jgi:hypothetical protein